MGKSVKFGHIVPYSKDATKSTASAENIQRSRRKISKGFRNDGSSEMSPLNVGVGGVFTATYAEEMSFRKKLQERYRAAGEMGDSVTLEEGDTYRVEEVSIQYQTERDRQGKPTGPITEESVIYFRPTSVLGDGPNMTEIERSDGKITQKVRDPDFGAVDWENRPRSYTKKVGGEIVEHISLS